MTRFITTDGVDCAKGVPFVAKTASYTLTTSDFSVVFTATGTGVTATLPTAASAVSSGNSHLFEVKNHSSSTHFITVAVSGGGNIEDVTSFTLLPAESLLLISDGTTWHIT